MARDDVSLFPTAINGLRPTRFRDDTPVPERVVQRCNRCGHAELVPVTALVPRIAFGGDGAHFAGFINDGHRGVRCSGCQGWDLSYVVPEALQQRLVAGSWEEGRP